MKKALTPFVLAAIFISTVVFASAKGPLKEKHDGKVGLDGAKINCVYCHKTAANPKTKGQAGYFDQRHSLGPQQRQKQKAGLTKQTDG